MDPLAAHQRFRSAPVRLGRLALAAVVLAPVAMLCGGCGPLRSTERVLRSLPEVVADTPRQNRDWVPHQAVLAYAEMDARGATIRNVRHCRWRSDSDAIVKHSDWKVAWDDVRAVDFIVVPFPNTPSLAHTMLSFELADGRHLVASIEARLQRGESFGAVAGSVRQFELMYVLGDETDLLGLRAEHRRDEAIYLYRSIATPAQSAELLRHVLRRTNQLAAHPEFYDSLANNCTTNLIEHINHLAPEAVPSTLRNLLPGHSDSMAYDLGLLQTDLPFAEARKRANVSMRIRQHLNDPDFSRKIRQPHVAASLPESAIAL
ncbi:Lnb N-terminal periplasmic domain-containing protein [Roseimaritima sediminicola]|uniref:Lnb N-terminal periplasmic domain-containing protein n=1 Tax=Roseimaritima sediminicola TaxID=2662066 RepID=UPI00129829AC|nr:DUF4105 domain-containing protein [Roseimaritima sediminicola]